jgi:hypothetical protein
VARWNFLRASPRSRLAYSCIHESTIAQTRGKSVSQVARNWLSAERRTRDSYPRYHQQAPRGRNRRHGQLGTEARGVCCDGSGFFHLEALAHQLSSDGKEYPLPDYSAFLPRVYACLRFSLYACLSLDSPILSSLPTHPDVVAAPQIL